MEITNFKMRINMPLIREQQELLKNIKNCLKILLATFENIYSKIIH